MIAASDLVAALFAENSEPERIENGGVSNGHITNGT